MSTRMSLDEKVSATVLAKRSFDSAYTEKHSSNIWEQMSYIPPRGPCRYTSTILGQACPCLRFMIHPSAAPTTFACDGCSHHASFHEMRNQSEDQIRSRWTKDDGTFDREAYEADEEVQQILAKRRQLGIMRPIHSSGDLTMPSKAQKTLVDGPIPPKKRKSNLGKTYDDVSG